LWFLSLLVVGSLAVGIVGMSHACITETAVGLIIVNGFHCSRIEVVRLLLEEGLSIAFVLDSIQWGIGCLVVNMKS
ncbi:MAG: hypothetical protein AAF518_03945, partial [Spirochaetota bacterium]